MKVEKPDTQYLRDELAEIAPNLLTRLKNGQTADWAITGSKKQFNIVLVQVGQMLHLSTYTWARQINHAERRAIIQAFNIPAIHDTDFGYDQGWGRMTFVWKTDEQPGPSPAQPEQTPLFSIENTAAYYQEA